MKRTFFLYFLSVMVMPFLASCDAGNGQNHYALEGDTIPMKYATHLTMIDFGDFIKADFRNPWDTTRTLQSFILIPNDNEMPSELPKGNVIRIPLERSIVYTSVHNNLISELGAIDAIIGVCDEQYITKTPLRERIEKGKITDCGTSMAPNIEKILQLKPNAILLSAFENSNDHNKVDQIGIPIVDCIDYMEISPLARAEWMRFFGVLYGKQEIADSLFADVEKSYMRTKELAATTVTRPAVMTDMIYGDSWDMPAAFSTIGVLIEDAGGTNPFDVYKKSGSVRLSPEEVLFRAKDSEIWLLKYSQLAPFSMSQLKRDNPIYTKFKPFVNNNIFSCNVKFVPYFEDAPFHPHWILAEYLSLIHPELGEQEDNHHFYTKLEK